MAETTTSTANDIYLAAAVDTVVIDEVRPYFVMSPFFRRRGPAFSNAFDFPIQDDPGAAGTKAEAAQLTPTTLSTSKATATVSTIAIMATVTKELTRISLIDALPHFSSVIGRSVGEKFETDGVALIDDFANTTGTSGVKYSWAQRQEATSALEQRDAVGQIVEVLHPVQVGNLREDMTTSTAAVWGNDNVMIDGIAAPALAGFAFSAFRVPTFMTSLVNTANAGADRAGAQFITDLALGLYVIWEPETQTDDDISLLGTEVVVSTRYGMIEVRDVWGESIITNA